jgi:protein-disulfide isomerase
MFLSKHQFLSTISAAMLSAVIVLTGPAAAQPAGSGTISAEQKKAFEGIVRDYILENPEIITQAIERLRENQRLAEAQADQNILAASRAEIFNDPDAPEGGNPKGDVTIVEFFDYRCGVCKRLHPIVNELVKTDPNIRRVYKEWPILGPNSVLAARAAIASRQQGKYLAFHKVMMETNSSFDRASILRMAKSVGLDTAQLDKVMKSPEVDAIIRKNYALAEKLKLNGTPSFVIGDTLLRGGRDLESLRAIVAEARAAKK